MIHSAKNKSLEASCYEGGGKRVFEKIKPYLTGEISANLEYIITKNNKLAFIRVKNKMPLAKHKLANYFMNFRMILK